jgi:hypothetical protein
MYYGAGMFGAAPPVTPPSMFWNPPDTSAAVLSNQNLTVTFNVSPFCTVGTQRMDFTSGNLIYFELDWATLPVAAPMFLGLRQSFDGFSIGAADGAATIYPFPLKFTDLAIYSPNAVTKITAGGNITAINTGSLGIVQGDRTMHAYNFTTGKGWLGINNVWLNGGNPAAGTNPQWTGIDPTLEWRFYVNGGNANFAGSPVVINACFGNTLFPQLFATPAGFTSLITPAHVNYYGGFNIRDASPLWTHPNAATPTQPLYWRVNATIFLGDVGSGGSVGVMRAPNKYYWELAASPVAGTAEAYLGFQQRGNGAVQGNMHPSGTFAAAGCTSHGAGAAFGTNEYIGFGLDLSSPGNGKCFVTDKNGNWLNGSDPVAGTNPSFDGIPTNIDLCARCAVNTSVACLILSPTYPGLQHPVPSGYMAGIPTALGV